MWNHSEPEDSFGEPPKSHAKGKGIAFALVPTILLLTGIGFRIARTAQKAERLINHHASTTVTTTAVTVVLEQCLDIQVTGMFQGSFEECYLRERKLVGIQLILCVCPYACTH